MRALNHLIWISTDRRVEAKGNRPRGYISAFKAGGGGIITVSCSYRRKCLIVVQRADFAKVSDCWEYQPFFWNSLFSPHSRLCLPAFPGRDLCSGTDRCLHRGGQQALPVCIQSHHQRQTSKWQTKMKKVQIRLKMVPLLLMVSTKPKSLRLNKREGDNKVIRTHRHGTINVHQRDENYSTNSKTVWFISQAPRMSKSLPKIRAEGFTIYSPSYH